MDAAHKTPPIHLTDLAAHLPIPPSRTTTPGSRHSAAKEETAEPEQTEEKKAAFPSDGAKRLQILETAKKTDNTQPEREAEASTSEVIEPRNSSSATRKKSPGREQADRDKITAEEAPATPAPEEEQATTQLPARRTGQVRTFLEDDEAGRPPFRVAGLDSEAELATNAMAGLKKPSYAGEVARSVDLPDILMHWGDDVFDSLLKTGDAIEWNEKKIGVQIDLLKQRQVDLRATLQTHRDNNRLNPDQFKLYHQLSLSISKELDRLDTDHKKSKLEHGGVALSLFLIFMVSGAIQIFVPTKELDPKYRAIMFCATLYAGFQTLSAMTNKNSSFNTVANLFRRKFMVNLAETAPFLPVVLGGPSSEELKTNTGFNAFVTGLGLLGFLIRAEPRTFHIMFGAIGRMFKGAPMMEDDSTLADMMILVKSDMFALENFRSKFKEKGGKLSSVKNENITLLLGLYQRMITTYTRSLPKEPISPANNSTTLVKRWLSSAASGVSKKFSKENNREWKEKFAVAILIAMCNTAAIPLLDDKSNGDDDLISDDIGTFATAMKKVLNLWGRFDVQNLMDDWRDMGGFSALLTIFFGADYRKKFLEDSEHDSFIATGALAAANLTIKTPVGKLGADGLMLVGEGLGHIVDGIRHIGKKDGANATGEDAPTDDRVEDPADEQA